MSDSKIASRDNANTTNLQQQVEGQVGSPAYQQKSVDLESLMRQNRSAWDKSCEEYTDFCKAYYINLVLTNRYQQLIEQRQELISRLKNKDKVPSNPFQNDLQSLKQVAGGKPGRG